MRNVNEIRLRARKIPCGKIREIEDLVARGHTVIIQEKFPRRVIGINITSPKTKIRGEGKLAFLEL